jgi:hypothetical protein
VFNATFAAPCLTRFCRLDELGLEAVGQQSLRAVLRGVVVSGFAYPSSSASDSDSA